MKIHSLLHFNDRPTNTPIDCIVLHSIFAPTCPDIFNPSVCISSLDEHKVSSHYLIERTGTIWKLVDEPNRAWHAGPSKMPFSDDARDDVNNFSIGIELIGSDTSGFTDAQYEALTTLIDDISKRYPIKTVIGHDAISPDRKCDPGPCFDWEKLKRSISNAQLRFFSYN